ncbi:MATE family efflux transporter [Aureibacillus halotolerans]|uniref:Putative MATE family efflux protein n=1 Tax=Aureibacillus halotolerans TaxID=1508390 RepID=A0A4R6U7W3_9BACI|nr:MATE family efflux transporter [Aureibacillus halotolerans]TDQ42618.1 putative MATE family efflux protein [Aureibacillus halotolerans]
MLQSHHLRLFAVSWPIFIELLLLRLMGLVDTFMLSAYSDDAVAAVGFANQILMMVTVALTVMTIGVTILVSRSLGANETEEASQLAKVAILLNAIIGLALGVMLAIFAAPLLEFFQLPAHLVPTATSYLIIVGSPLVIQSTMLTMTAIFKSHGFTKQAMYVAFAVNGLNIIGNYVAIFGPFGLPVTGVTGVAVSTVLSQLIGAWILFRLLIRKNLISKSNQRFFVHARHDVKRLFRLGAPSSLDAVAWNTHMMTITVCIATIGAIALTTNLYANTLKMFITAFAGAMGQGTMLLISRLLGAKQNQAAYHQSHSYAKWAMATSIGMAFLMYSLSDPLLKWFTDDEAIITLGKGLLLTAIVLEPGRALNLIYNNALKSAGDVKFPMIVNIIGMWGISVPLSFVFGIMFHWGLIGIWWAFVIDEWVRGCVLLIRWTSCRWQQKEKSSGY